VHDVAIRGTVQPHLRSSDHRVEGRGFHAKNESAVADHLREEHCHKSVVRSDFQDAIAPAYQLGCFGVLRVLSMLVGVVPLFSGFIGDPALEIDSDYRGLDHVGPKWPEPAVAATRQLSRDREFQPPGQHDSAIPAAVCSSRADTDQYIEDNRKLPA
jgi:hypothetical protein